MPSWSGCSGHRTQDTAAAAVLHPPVMASQPERSRAARRCRLPSTCMGHAGGALAGSQQGQTAGMNRALAKAAAQGDRQLNMQCPRQSTPAGRCPLRCGGTPPAQGGSACRGSSTMQVSIFKRGPYAMTVLLGKWAAGASQHADPLPPLPLGSHPANTHTIAHSLPARAAQHRSKRDVSHIAAAAEAQAQQPWGQRREAEQAAVPQGRAVGDVKGGEAPQVARKRGAGALAQPARSAAQVQRLQAGQGGQGSQAVVADLRLPGPAGAMRGEGRAHTRLRRQVGRPIQAAAAAGPAGQL